MGEVCPSEENFTDVQAQSPHVRICSDHFKHDRDTHRDYMKFHLQCAEWKNLRLLPGAVPTIQPKFEGASQKRPLPEESTSSADLGFHCTENLSAKRKSRSATRKLTVASEHS